MRHLKPDVEKAAVAAYIANELLFLTAIFLTSFVGAIAYLFIPAHLPALAQRCFGMNAIIALVAMRLNTLSLLSFDDNQRKVKAIGCLISILNFVLVFLFILAIITLLH